MGRGVRVFHAPGQSPYSVLVEQRGVLNRTGVSIFRSVYFSLVDKTLQLKKSLFQAILTLSPAKAEPLKKTYVKLL